MVIRFQIPHGEMAVLAEEFFQYAGKRQIKKMLKLLRDSGPSPETTAEIREWLKCEMRETYSRAESRAGVYVTRQEELAWLEDVRERLKSPAQDCEESQLRGVVEMIRISTVNVKAAKRSMDSAVKLFKRYNGILGDVDRIMPGRNER